MSAETRSGSGLHPNVRLPDRYAVKGRIAQGGMAAVWCAHDTALRREVAIKLLAEQFLHDDAAVRRFQREARAAARLSGHPHVVTIFDVGQALAGGEPGAGRPFIVMEYLSGGTVADALRVGAVDRDLALRWLYEAAAALDYAHGRGVVHRDIKPGNLLVDNERRLHVGDFGIARVGTEDTITTTGLLFGTAAYISPEQAVGRPATEASDRYSLAIVAYELLVGERPFAGEHFAGQARQHIEQQPPRASRHNHALPRAVDAVLARGMAKRPQDRWGSAGELVAALSDALRRRERPVPSIVRAPAPVTEPLIVPGARAKHPPRVLALAALGAAAFAVGATAGASNEDGGRAPTKPAARSAVLAVRTPVPRATHKRTVPAKPPPPRTTPSTPTTHAATTTPTQTKTQTATGVPASAPAPPPTGDTLEARGHQLMLAGSYGQAIAVLRQALAAAPPSSLTYAYALYDLGRSLRLGGDPRAAAVVLQQRLQIPNQTDVVRHELELALREIGAQLQGPPGDGHGRRKDHGHP